MNHDNQKDRNQFVQWLKDNGLYDPMLSAVSMRNMSDVYWKLIDNAKQTKDVKCVLASHDTLYGAMKMADDRLRHAVSSICSHMVKVETVQSRVELLKTSNCSTYTIEKAIWILCALGYLESYSGPGIKGYLFQWYEDTDSDSYVMIHPNIHHVGNVN